VAAVALGLALASPAAGHDVERTEALLVAVAEHRRTAHQAPTEGERVEATFRLGETVEMLVDAVNRDVAVHGTPDLFAELVVKRLQAQGLSVAWTPAEQRYVYDLAAFHDCIRRAPHGPWAPEAKFRLIARRFYATLGANPATLVGTDVAGVLEAVADEARFLREHASHPRAGTVRFFLAVDHYRVSRNIVDPARAREHAGRARRALRETVTRSTEPFERRAAQALLETLGF
jgi:hypothetical protein